MKQSSVLLLTALLGSVIMLFSSMYMMSYLMPFTRRTPLDPSEAAPTFPPSQLPELHGDNILPAAQPTPVSNVPPQHLLAAKTDGNKQLKVLDLAIDLPYQPNSECQCLLPIGEATPKCSTTASSCFCRNNTISIQRPWWFLHISKVVQSSFSYSQPFNLCLVTSYVIYVSRSAGVI